MGKLVTFKNLLWIDYVTMIQQSTTAICVCYWIIETEMLSFLRNCRDLLHCKLSKWQSTVQPVMKMWSKQRHFRFMICCLWLGYFVPSRWSPVNSLLCHLILKLRIVVTHPVEFFSKSRTSATHHLGLHDVVEESFKELQNGASGPDENGMYPGKHLSLRHAGMRTWPAVPWPRMRMKHV